MPEEAEQTGRGSDVARGIIVDVLFVGGFGLFAFGVWQLWPDYAPVIIGISMMTLGAIAHYLRS